MGGGGGALLRDVTTCLCLPSRINPLSRTRLFLERIGVGGHSYRADKLHNGNYANGSYCIKMISRDSHECVGMCEDYVLSGYRPHPACCR